MQTAKLPEMGRMMNYIIDESAEPDAELPCLPISDNTATSLTEGDELWMVGYPQIESGIAVHRKLLTGFSDPTRSALLVDMVNTAGSPGGPVINEQGHLVAIISSDEHCCEGGHLNPDNPASVIDTAKGLCVIRNIAMLNQAHGLPANLERVPLTLRWRDSVQRSVQQLQQRVESQEQRMDNLAQRLGNVEQHVDDSENGSGRHTAMFGRCVQTNTDKYEPEPEKAWV